MKILGKKFIIFVLMVVLNILGETMVSLQKASLIPGGSDSMVYTTLSGTEWAIRSYIGLYDNKKISSRRSCKDLTQNNGFNLIY